MIDLDKYLFCLVKLSSYYGVVVRVGDLGTFNSGYRKLWADWERSRGAAIESFNKMTEDQMKPVSEFGGVLCYLEWNYSIEVLEDFKVAQPLEDFL